VQSRNRKDRVSYQEDVDFKCPSWNLAQSELPPPEMHESEEHTEHPAEMYRIGFVMAGILHKASNPSEKPRDA
jgi:hypothetical protein